mgnify:CR=1 FL=1
MQPYWQRHNSTIYIGDARSVVSELPKKYFQTCITSPPYFRLRDYNHDKQIGQEDTPEKFINELVEVFSFVRETLKDDGTLWINIADTYMTSNKKPKHSNSEYKIKDLLGIPWMLAFALQKPYYAGQIKNELDRVWIAAMLDAEGSICGSEYQSGERTKTNIYISITNTSVPIIEKCERLFPQEVKHVYEKVNKSNRPCFRWDVERLNEKATFLREIYPYLIAKRKQAILAYTLLEMQRGLKSKKKGYLAEQQEQRSWLIKTLSFLNSGQDVDVPSWCIEPPSLFEPGYYLRQDIIWHKTNARPENAKGRCDCDHEYMFLFSKSKDYRFNEKLIQVPSVSAGRIPGGNKKNDLSRNDSDRDMSVPVKNMRNRRSVWSVATKGIKAGHYAPFPAELIDSCIKATCGNESVVLDPFLGSGTTIKTALRAGCSGVGIELNPEYADIAIETISPVAASLEQDIFR